MRKGTGHFTSQSRWPMTSVHSNRHFPNVRIVYGTYLYLIGHTRTANLVNVSFKNSHDNTRSLQDDVECTPFSYFRQEDVGISDIIEKDRCRMIPKVLKLQYFVCHSLQLGERFPSYIDFSLES